MGMGCQVNKLLGLLFFLCSASVNGQRVLYSPFLRSAFDVTGRVGDYYWVELKETIHVPKKKDAATEDTIHQRNFGVFDTRMNLVNITEPGIRDDKVLKEYLICNNHHFDQLLIRQDSDRQVGLVLTRYSPDGQMRDTAVHLMSFPFSEPPNSFLITRSEDRQLILLLCFQSYSEGTRLHAIIFDENWRRLSYKTYDKLLVSQPLIQDDFTNFPIEFFESSPLKIANNGDWLMMLPSRINNNFSLYHFTNKDNQYVYREIRLPIYSIWEDVVLYADNQTHQVNAGVLSSFRYPTLKNVQVIRYSMDTHQYDFDSSFRFNTLIGYKVKDENLTHQQFLTIPGKGFLFLKEYGRPFEPEDEINEPNSSRVLKFFFASNSISSSLQPLSINKDEYTRYNRLVGSRRSYERGDLSLFYFSGSHGDSSWSGIVNKEQATEFNIPWLSYLVFPRDGKLYILYNSVYHNDQRFNNTTVLDPQGRQITDEGVIYWKFGNVLDFQKARRIGEDEIAVPYENSKRFGFAIIRF